MEDTTIVVSALAFGCREECRLDVVNLVERKVGGHRAFASPRLNSPKREEVFRPLGITARTFQDPQGSKRVG